MNASLADAGLRELVRQQQETIYALQHKLKITAYTLPLIKMYLHDRDSLVLDLKAKIARFEEYADNSRYIESILDDFELIKAETERSCYDSHLQAIYLENDRLRAYAADLLAKLQVCERSHVEKEQQLQTEINALERALVEKNELLESCKQALKLYSSWRRYDVEEASKQDLQDN